MTPVWSRWAPWGAPALVAIATLIAFSPGLSNGFVDWDDPMNFIDNTAYRGLDWSHLRWMATAFHLGVYQPLAWGAAGVEYRLGGLDPWVYHTGSWLLHAANAALVYVIALLLLAPAAGSPTRLRVCAAVAALLFALHPLRVEAVAWASAQGYPLAGLFFTGSIAAYLRAQRWPERADDLSGGPSAPRRGWLLLSIALGLLAYLAKPIAVTLPAVLVLLDWYPLRRFGLSKNVLRASSAVWVEKLPYAIPAALVAAAAPVARTVVSDQESVGLLFRCARAGYGLAFYLWKTLAPFNLSHYYAAPIDMNPFHPRFLISALAVVAIGSAVWYGGRRRPGLTAAAWGYVILLSPVLGLVTHGLTLAADRYTYFAGAPIAIVIGAGLMAAWKHAGTTRRPVRLWVGLVAIAVLGLGTLTWRQVTVWRDPGTLWAHAVAVAPKDAQLSFQVHNNLGLYYLDQRRYDDAQREFEETLRRNPSSYKGHFNLGRTLAYQNRIDEAIAEYARGLALRPDDATALAHVAELVARRGRYAEAETLYRRAVELTQHPDLFNSLGITLAEQGRLEEALAAFREALARDPSHADAQANLAMALGTIPPVDGGGPPPRPAPSPPPAGSPR